MLRGCYKEYSELFSIEIVYAIYILYKSLIIILYYKAWGRVTLPELNFSKEHFTGFSAKIKANYTSLIAYLSYNLE